MTTNPTHTQTQQRRTLRPTLRKRRPHGTEYRFGYAHTPRRYDNTNHIIEQHTTTRTHPPNEYDHSHGEPNSSSPPNVPLLLGRPRRKADKLGVWLRHFELLWEPTATDLEKITT